jgi:hypothetical protein
VVPNESEPICLDVEMRVESSNIVDANAALCDTCNRYFVAPAEALQVKVTVVG